MDWPRARTAPQTLVVAGVLAGLVWASSPAHAGEPPAPDAAGPGTAVERKYRGRGFPAFREGFRAWEIGDWKEAANHMAAALEADRDQQPQALVRVLGCLTFPPYIPRFFQSHAQCRLRQCDEARRDLDDVLRLIRDRPDLRKRYQKDCQKACPLSEAPADGKVAAWLVDTPDPGR